MILGALKEVLARLEYRQQYYTNVPMDYSTFPTPSPKHETLEFIKRFARLQHNADTALVEGLKVHILCPQANSGAC